MLLWDKMLKYYNLYRYAYQLPPEQLNHTCGGANVWADHSRSDELFCSAGYYCPTTTLKLPCGSG